MNPPGGAERVHKTRGLIDPLCILCTQRRSLHESRYMHLCTFVHFVHSNSEKVTSTKQPSQLAENSAPRIWRALDKTATLRPRVVPVKSADV